MEKAVRAIERARVRAKCYWDVVELDIAKYQGRIRGEKYQEALARIRDYGIMRGLSANNIRETFDGAHRDAYKINSKRRSQSAPPSSRSQPNHGLQHGYEGSH